MNSPTIPKVLELIRQRLSCRFPKVSVVPFGSMVIGLGRQGGDLDIFVDVGNCYFGKPSKSKMKDVIFQTLRILQSKSNEWSDFEAVTHARTPILRVYCRAFKTDCDLSFSNGLSHCNTELIKYFIGIQPICKKVRFSSNEQKSFYLHMYFNVFFPARCIRESLGTVAAARSEFVHSLTHGDFLLATRKCFATS